MKKTEAKEREALTCYANLLERFPKSKHAFMKAVLIEAIQLTYFINVVVKLFHCFIAAFCGRRKGSR